MTMRLDRPDMSETSLVYFARAASSATDDRVFHSLRQ